MHFVGTRGPKNWVQISQYMQHRTPKQCRERYHQNLKPTLNHAPITAEEGELIEELVEQMGKRWAEIARRLGNRSDNAVKNWWNGSMNRRQRTTAQPSGSKMMKYRAQPIPTSAAPPPWYLQEQLAPAQEVCHTPFSHPQHGRPPDARPPSVFSDADNHRQRTWYGTPSHTDHVPSPATAPSEPGQIWLHERAPRDVLHQRRTETGPHTARDTILPRSYTWPAAPFSERQEWHLPPASYVEAPVPSPAATEASHTSSNLQAPSLVSDHQSTCSISPKTIALLQPRNPGLRQAPVPLRPEICSNTGPDHYPEARCVVTETTPFFQSLPPPSPNRPDHLSLPTTVPTSLRSRTLSFESSARSEEPSQKDTRMRVSHLLE